MKTTTEKLMIWTKRIVLVLAVTAGVMLPSCEKEKYDVNVPFYYDNTDNKELEDESLRNYASDKYVRNIWIYIVPGEKFTDLAADNISRLRLILSGKMDISPKVRGRGNLIFRPGACTYGDSLDFVKMGFTVNQQNQLF